jgi:polysaccharide export outer membrane protein
MDGSRQFEVNMNGVPASKATAARRVLKRFRKLIGGSEMKTLIMIGLLACSHQLNAEDLAGTAMFGQSEYKLGPEDVIKVFVWKQPELSTTVVIRPDGKISLPLLGELEATGKTAVQLQEEITARLLRYVADPMVNVTVTEVNSPKISVLGQVNKPDRYPIKQRLTVLDAIALAGGFTDFAKRDKITIIRNGGSDTIRIQVNLKKLVQDGGGEVYYVEPLDTIYVQ